MDLSNFDFNLPQGLIASRPLTPRSCAKLLFYEQSSIKDLIFFNLPDILNKNDLLVFNNTKVLISTKKVPKSEKIVEKCLFWPNYKENPK